MLSFLARLARLGATASPAAKARLDAVLAPTAWWYLARASARVRDSAAAASGGGGGGGGAGVNPNPNLDAFDAYWGKLLLPTGTWGDVYAWAQNDRFRAVARLEFLRSRYAGTETYRAAEKLLTVCDGGGGKLRTDRLPSRRQLIKVFGMADWNWSDKSDGEGTNASAHGLEDARKNDILRTRVSVVDGAYDLSSQIRLRGAESCRGGDGGGSGAPLWDLEDILEAGGCCVHGRSEFNLFAEEHQMYEVLTRDYVAALAETIMNIRERRHVGALGGGETECPNHDDDFIVVEIGAGSGALSHHVRRRLYELEHKGTARAKNIDVIATDSGSWKLDSSDFPVEPYTVKEALERLKPDLVLTSWMPAGVDWTKAFRRAGVKDYLLIGEADDGCTGHNWLTWGNKAYRDARDHEMDKMGGRAIASPFAEDGYARTDLHELARLQLQRYDCKIAPNQSTTVLFSK
jgi:hypothetical protein